MEIKRHLAVYHNVTKMEYQATHSKQRNSSNYLTIIIIIIIVVYCELSKRN